MWRPAVRNLDSGWRTGNGAYIVGWCAGCIWARKSKRRTICGWNDIATGADGCSNWGPFGALHFIRFFRCKTRKRTGWLMLFFPFIPAGQGQWKYFPYFNFRRDVYRAGRSMPVRNGRKDGCPGRRRSLYATWQSGLPWDIFWGLHRPSGATPGTGRPASG